MTTFILKGLKRPLSKMVPIDPSGQAGVSGYTSRPDGFQIADIEVTVDLETIAREWGLRAMKNKSGMAKALHGDVVVRVSNRRRIAE